MTCSHVPRARAPPAIFAASAHTAFFAYPDMAVLESLKIVVHSGSASASAIATSSACAAVETLTLQALRVSPALADTATATYVFGRSGHLAAST